MPVLKIKQNGEWEELGGTSPMDGGNADTLDGKHASEFASATDVSDLQSKVGDIPVQDQINNALSVFDVDSDVYVQNEEPIDAPDGALWVDLDEDGTVSNGSGSVVVNVDTTLTLDGYAADAKVVGDTISGINDEITGIEDEIDGINNVITGINNTVSGINDAVTNINNALDTTNTTVTGINNTVNELSSEVDGLDINIQNLSNTVNQISSKVGDTSVSDQITTAINSLRAEILGGAW